VRRKPSSHPEDEAETYTPAPVQDSSVPARLPGVCSVPLVQFFKKHVQYTVQTRRLRILRGHAYCQWDVYLLQVELAFFSQKRNFLSGVENWLVERTG
jgi:hypothetical protein